MAYLMVIDDEEDFATLTAQALREDGHEVRIELDLKSAAKSLKERQPDAVILDVMFPGDQAGGFKLAWKIRSEYRIPVLMLTAVNTEARLSLGNKDIDNVWLPVAEFLEKPVDPDVLRNRVSSLLQETDPCAAGAGTER